jgi:hypothetical protein
VSVHNNGGARHTGELVDLGEGHVDLPWPRKTASRLAPAVRAYLAEVGPKAGHASGAGGRAVWKDVPADELAERMRALVRKR